MRCALSLINSYLRFYSSFSGEVKTRTKAVLLHRWPPFFTHLLLLTQSTVFQNFSKSTVPCFLLGIAFRVFPTQSIPHSRWDGMTAAEMDLGAPEPLVSLSLLPVFFLLFSTFRAWSMLGSIMCNVTGVWLVFSLTSPISCVLQDFRTRVFLAQ